MMDTGKTRWLNMLSFLSMEKMDFVLLKCVR